MTATLLASSVYPEQWQAGPSLPLLAAEPWHATMGGRFEGEPVWLWTPQLAPGLSGGPDVGLSGYVMDGPAGYVFSDGVRLVSDAASPFVSEETGPILAETVVDAAPCYPYLLLCYPGYATFPVGSGATEEGAVREALRAVVGWARERGLSAVVLPYAEAGGTLSRVARDVGFTGPVITHDSQLLLPEGGFSGYLAALPSKRRRKLRAERRRLHDRGLYGRRVERVTAPLLDRLAELRCNHRERYGLPSDHAAERARLTVLLDHFPDRTDVFTVGTGSADPDSPVLAFGLFVRDDTTWHALYTGNAYDESSRNAYFEAVYYTPLDAATEAGISRISYGLAADEAKRHRGCSSIPVECLLLGLTPEAEALVERVAAVWNRAPDQDVQPPDGDQS